MQFLNEIIANARNPNKIPLKISEKTGASFKRAKQLILPASVLSKNFKPEVSRNENEANFDPITSSARLNSKKVKKMMEK